MTISLPQLLEKVAGLMDKAAPRDLAECFRLILRFEREPAQRFGLKDLTAAMRSDDQSDGATLHIGRLLWRWDHAPEGAWTQATPPHSEARRERVFDLLALPRELRQACNDRYPVTGIDGPTVIAESHVPWYPPDGIDQFYWNAYARQLREVAGWPEESIISLDDSTRSVIERLSDPTRPEPYQSRGLVVGYVQSGKTANFTGVIARAADAGYRLFIVLGGLLDLLRDQTQRRLDKDLVGKELLVRGAENEYQSDSEWGNFVEHGGLPSELGSFDWQRLTGAHDDYSRLKKGLDALEFERIDKKAPFHARHNLSAAKARLIVIKKHPTVMERLIADLGSLRAKLADVPTLIIDDESDQASVNTTRPESQESEKVRTATNRQITRLLRLLPRAQYVGYTATPFANVFIDPGDVEDIFPKDFIISLDRPDHYMGVSDFYDLGGDAPDGYASNEKAHIRSVRGSDSEPGNLQAAIDTFVLTGAIKLYRERKGAGRFRHHTMLVHRSQRRKAHQEDADLVQGVFNQGGYATRIGYRRLEKLFAQDLQPVSAACAPELPFPRCFADLEPYIGECMTRLEGDKTVRIVNGDHRDDTPDFDRQPVWSILVGGTKLSRGYTVEGLTVSYYRRTARASDTLMQMGRWFGYRRNYKDLVRLFIGREEPLGKVEQLDLYEAFRAICLDEEEFRLELRQYASMTEPRITPKMVPPLVPSHLLRPTSANKMYNAKVVSENFGGRWCDKTNAPTKKGDIQHNDRAMKLLLRDRELHRTRLAVSVEGTARDFPALVGTLSPDAVVDFLAACRWSGDNPHLLARQLDFLRGKHGDAQIERWLVVAPQTQDGTGAKWQAHGIPFAVRHRARVTPEGDRYKVYTEPAHKDVATYLCGLIEGDRPSKETVAWRHEHQAVFLFYPVRDEKTEQLVSMGFALLFPRNSIATPIRFSVHDPRNASAVTVSAGRRGRGAGLAVT